MLNTRSQKIHRVHVKEGIHHHLGPSLKLIRISRSGPIQFHIQPALLVGEMNEMLGTNVANAGWDREIVPNPLRDFRGPAYNQ
jgi:hypothetical protein